MKKDSVLRIRCSKKTMTRFKVLVAALGFTNYEEALNWLLDRAEPEIHRARVF